MSNHFSRHGYRNNNPNHHHQPLIVIQAASNTAERLVYEDARKAAKAAGIPYDYDGASDKSYKALIAGYGNCRLTDSCVLSELTEAVLLFFQNCFGDTKYFSILFSTMFGTSFEISLIFPTASRLRSIRLYPRLHFAFCSCNLCVTTDMWHER